MAGLRFRPCSIAPLLAAMPLLAQTSTTGAISGLVKDPQGKPIAGASVRAQSAQIQRTAVADKDGEFHFGLLNAGPWTLEVTRPGFTTLSVAVTVTTDTVHPVQIRMAPLVQATVEVLATALQVDLSTHTQGSSFLAPDLERLPTGRNLNDLLLLGPGVEDSGFSSGTGATNWSGNPSVSGASSLENQYILDGLVTNDFRSGFQGAVVPKDWVEQFELQTGGFAPEYSALGGVVVAVTKQGTNNFAGSLSYTSTLPQLQASSTYNPAIGQLKPNDPQRAWDTTFTAGGPLVKDKLFYFIGGAFSRIDPDRASVTANNQGLKSDPQKDDSRNLYGKVNWFPHRDHQLTFVIQDRVRDRGQDNLHPSPNGTAQTGAQLDDKTRNLNLNWDWTLSPNMLLAVKAGRSAFSLVRTPTDATTVLVNDKMYYSPNGPWGSAPLPSGTLPSSGFVSGGIGGYVSENAITTRQLRADFSWLLDHHAFKAGVSSTQPDWSLKGQTSGGYSITLYQFNSGASKYQFRGLERDFYSRDSRATGDYFALYAQDTWELAPGFRLKYGLRYERQDLKDTQGETYLKFSKASDVTQPRIGFTWDLKGDGRTKVAGSYGRYYEQVPLSLVMGVGGGQTYIYEYYSPARASYDLTTRAWAITGPPDGIPGINGGIPVNNYSAHWAVRPPIEEGLKIPQRDEFTLGLDHQFASGWMAGTHFRWRKMTNVVEDSVPTDREGNPIDGEGFSILWNPKAGATVRWRNNAEHSNPGALNVWANDVFPTAYNLYRAIDFTLAKQGSDYSLECSYTLSRFEGSYEGLAVQFQASANLSFTYDYWPYVGTGTLPLDHTHSVKLAATKSFPLFGHRFTVGTFARFITGIPTTDWDDTNDFGGYGPVVPIGGKYGNHGRYPDQTMVDLNLRYELTFGRLKVAPTLDIFNVFNKHTVTAEDENKAWAEYPYPEGNPTWRMPWAWLEGRRFRVGVAVKF